MRHFINAALPIVMLLFALPAAATEPGDGAIDLLDGTVGWKYFSQDPESKYADGWETVDGVLHCKGKPLGYIYTEKSYTNFVLTLEWRIAPHATPHKGGVLIRTTGKPRIWPRSLEAQINHPDAGDFWGLDGYTLDGPKERKKNLMHKEFGLLTNLAKTAKAERPLGEWNRYEITAQGETVTLKINGQQVNQATGCDVVAGAICLTAEGNGIQFRNVKLRPLD